MGKCIKKGVFVGFYVCVFDIIVEILNCMLLMFGLFVFLFVLCELMVMLVSRKVEIGLMVIEMLNGFDVYIDIDCEIIEDL